MPNTLLFAQATTELPSHLPGFLGTRGSFMLDFVFAAMFGIILVMGYSIYLVKYQQRYELHKWIQIVLGVVLLVAVAAFEIDMRFFTDWEELAKPSRFYQEGTWDGVWISLAIHLLFAVPTPFLWIYVIVQAIRKFSKPAQPGPYSPTHIFWAKLAALGMFLTSVTGWVFYVIAFVM
jgi:putative membrane protein